MLKERLLESAFQKFSTDGYIATNPDTITKPLGVSRVTFYSYFKSKNDILLYLVKDIFEELSGLLKDKKAHKAWLNADSIEKFEEPLNYIVDILLGYSGIFGAFIQGMMGDRELLGYFSKISERFSKMFRPKIISLQKSGRYQGCNATVLSQIMTTTFFMSIFSFSIHIIGGDKKSLARTISILFFSSFNMNEKNIISLNRNQPKSEKGRSTRRIILETARNEFEHNGSKGITIAHIAEKAGLSRGTVYKYFKKKEDIKNGLKKEFPGFLNGSSLPDSLNDSHPDTKNLETGKGQLHHAGNGSATTDKSILTRKNIISAAIQEFSEKGYFESTIENIAKRAGLSRSTLYLYFKKKDDLIIALLQDMLSILNPTDSFSLLDDHDTTSIDDTFRIVYMVVEIYENFATPNWAILQGSFHSKELFDNFKALHDLFGEALKKKIDEIMKEGLCLDVESDIAARVIMACLSYSSTMHNAGIIKCTRNEMALNLTKFLFSFFNFNTSLKADARRLKGTKSK